MMEIRADVKGIEEVKRVFQALPTEIARKALRGALMDGADVIRRQAQAMAPKARGGAAYWATKGRAPGRLKASIVRRARARPRQGDATVSIGATRNAFYWHMVEFGHRLVRGRRGAKRQVGTVAPRPFLRPAFAQAGPAAVQRVFERLGPRIEAIARSLRRRVARLGL